MKYTHTLLLLLFCSVCFAQVTPLGAPNVTVQTLGGLNIDSAFRPPFISPTKRYTKGMDTTAQFFVSTTDTLPKFMKKGLVVKTYTEFDTNKIGSPVTPYYVSSVVATAGSAYVPLAQKAVANGVASLDASGFVPITQIPALPINNTFVASSVAQMYTLAATVGDICVRTDSSKSFILQTAGTSVYAHWVLILAPQPVLAFNSRIGSVIPLSIDYKTDSVPEGLNNFYFTPARTQTVIGTDTTTFLATKTNIRPITNETTQTILGRYAGTNGAVQEITIGANLTLNTSTGVLSSNAGSGTVTGVIAGSGINVSGTTIPTVSIAAVTVYTVTESTQMSLNFATNGPVQWLTLAHANDTITLSGISVIDKRYTLYVQNDGVSGRVLRWGSAVVVAYGAQGQPPHTTTTGSVDRYIITVGPAGKIYVDYGLNYNGGYLLGLLLLFSIIGKRNKQYAVSMLLLLIPFTGHAQTYLPPQAQLFCSFARTSAGYTMRAKDVYLIHGFALRIYNTAHIDGVECIDIHQKIQFCYPVIGTNKPSQGIDFIRLTSIPSTNWFSVPAGAIYNRDGSFDLNNPATSGLPRTQYVITDFIPPSNQITYHLGYYSTDDTPPSNIVEVGNGNGISKFLNLGVLQNAFLDAGSPGIYSGIYSSTPGAVSNFFGATSLGFFISNRISSSIIELYQPPLYFASIPNTYTASINPGPIWIGKDQGAVWTYSNRGCAGVIGGIGLTGPEALSEGNAFLFLHNNK